MKLLQDPDDLRLLQIRLALLYDKVAEEARNTRTCPGPYWRKSNEREMKRRRQMCSGHFTKFYLGPPPSGGGGSTTQVLCDACGQLWARDKKKKSKE